jgi:hypothetical protein
MYVYQFMPSNYALDDLRKRRLKVSRLEDMNDPFELLGGTFAVPKYRPTLRRWKKHMSQVYRVLCFSKKWSNPVLWSHYADKHRGMCLCFRVPERFLVEISYQAQRLEFQLEKHLQLDGTVAPEVSNNLLATKFADWKYEEEVRMFVEPEEVREENGLHFYDFNELLSLQKVILGPRCTVPLSEVRAAIQAIDQPVPVVRSRLAFKSFKVVPLATRANKK